MAGEPVPDTCHHLQTREFVLEPDAAPVGGSECVVCEIRVLGAGAFKLPPCRPHFHGAA